MFFLRYPKTVISITLVLCVVGGFLAVNRVKFSFNLEDFFPTNDPDLAFFKEFKERFEPDDNFVMVGLYREQGVFDSVFLQRAQDFSLDLRRLEFPMEKLLEGDTMNENVYGYKPDGKGDSSLVMRPITSVQSILNFEYPIKTPLFGFTSTPAVHLEDPTKYQQDRERILADVRMKGVLLSEDAKTLVFIAKTHIKTSQYVAKNLIYGIHALLEKHKFSENEYHLLGPANFQTRLPEVQIREFLFSMVVSSLLILLSLFLIFRRFWGIFVAMVSITVGLFLFIGYLGAMGERLDTMALLYPIIMIIVGISDVIHVMTKYVDELQKGHEKMAAIKITIKEIGASVFLTSFTTAIGFFSLYSSEVAPIRNFGINAGVGVVLAYISVMVFTTPLLTFFRKEQIAKISETESKWTGMMSWLYHFVGKKGKLVAMGTVVIMGICAWGMSRISTNNRIEDLLPIGEKVTKDFQFFEQQFSGFRPLDIAVTARDTNNVNDYAIMRDIAKLEDFMTSLPEIKSAFSATTVHRSIHRALGSDRVEAYKFPETPEKYEETKRLSKRFLRANAAPFSSADGKYARISARFLDIGADRSRELAAKINTWIAANIDTKLAEYKQTGTGLLVDKNSVYMRDSLIWGLGFAFIVIAITMGILYRSFKMMIISLIPNVIPLFVAAALLGFLGIPLEAGVAIVFSIIFGIAVDDTIHILGRFRILKGSGYDTNEAMRITLLETGKAVSLTSILLFAGFSILMFSCNPPAITVGLLISLTLLSALAFDLFLLPVLLLKWVK